MRKKISILAVIAALLMLSKVKCYADSCEHLIGI